MQYQKEDNKIMYAIIFGVIFFMFILPEMNKNKNKNNCNCHENMSGLFGNAMGAISSVVTPPGRCSNNCCNAALNDIPQYGVINDAVCQGRGCVCLTGDEQDKLRKGALKVTDVF